MVVFMIIKSPIGIVKISVMKVQTSGEITKNHTQYIIESLTMIFATERRGDLRENRFSLSNSSCLLSFPIALIKSRQNSTITKERIDGRQLYKSKLRFTRFCFDAGGNWYRDDRRTAWSREMIERNEHTK